MQWLGTTYTRRFNIEHFQSGHLFQSRYIVSDPDPAIPQQKSVLPGTVFR